MGPAPMGNNGVTGGRGPGALITTHRALAADMKLDRLRRDTR
jgi:hypothetical protein